MDGARKSWVKLNKWIKQEDKEIMCGGSRGWEDQGAEGGGVQHDNDPADAYMYDTVKRCLITCIISLGQEFTAITKCLCE